MNMENEIIIKLDRTFDFFLPKDWVGREIKSSMDRKASVKDMIESYGVPHTEVGYMTFNRKEANLPYDQVSETIRFFGLERDIGFFSRCTVCNKKLVPRAKDEILHLLEPKTRLYFHTFLQCPECGNVFWKGSHCENMKCRFSSMGILIKD